MQTEALNPTPIRIYLAGENSRRQDYLWRALQQPIHTIAAPESAETVSDSTQEIARAKAAAAFAQAEVKPHHSHIVAADTMPYVPNGTPFRKPKNEVELMRNFGVLAAAAQKAEPARYTPTSHTSTAFVNGRATLENQRDFPMETAITLKPEAARWLATPQGTAYYLQAFRHFYEGQFNFRKVAGFCSILLSALRAVEQIDDTTLDRSEKDQVHATIHRLTYSLLAPISPQATLYLLEQMKGAPLQAAEEQAMYDRLNQWEEMTAIPERVMEWRARPTTHPWENSSVTNTAQTR